MHTVGASVSSLEQIARAVRRDVVEGLYATEGYHLGPSFSIVDILVALYFRKMRVDPANPQWPNRDRLVLSRGHGSSALYAILAHRGFLPREEPKTMKTFRRPAPGPPGTDPAPGIEFTTGSGQ